MTRLSRRALTGLLGLALAGTACGSEGSSRASRPAPRATAGPSGGGAGQVTIHLVAFDPGRVEIAAGTAVTWTQEDNASVHTVTSGTVDTDATGATTVHPDGRFDSGQLGEGGTFSFTFQEPGTYPYFCVIHQATMRGEVSVR
jgi:plastocyanin